MDPDIQYINGTPYVITPNGAVRYDVWERQNAPRSADEVVGQQTIPTQVQQAEADLRRTQAQTQNAQIDANVAQATAPADIRLRNAQADKAQAEAESIRSGREMTASERANAIRGFTASMSLSQIIADLESRFNEGPGSTSGVLGAADYLPTAANERFNRASNAARGIVGDVLGFTGGQLNSAQEAQMNVGPYIPQASDKDEVIRDSINRLRNLQQQGIQRSVAILGGIPDAAGNIVPVPQDAALDASTVQQVLAAPADERQSVWDQTFVNTGPAQMSAQTGGNTSTPIPPEMQQEYQSFVLNNIQNMTPQSYAQFRRGQDQKFGYASTADYEAEGQRIIDGFKQGGTLNLTIPPIEREMTLGETARNAIVDNPFGAGAANFADMVGMGGVSALAGDQMAALREDRPVASTIGQIGGAIAGTSGLGRLGREIAKRAAPNILGGGARGQFARNLATDMTYGAGYGGVTEGDPLSGAAEAGVGSALGQGVGSAIGRAVGGVKNSPAVQTLVDRGIPLTVGQRLGGTLGRIEERAASLPLVGDMIRNRRIEGMEAFNRAAFDDAGRPINARVSDIGQEGIEALSDQVSDAYTDATTGVSVPFDNQFLADMQAASQRAANLPGPERRRLAQVLDARVQPLLQSGGMTGNTYQQSVRGLKSARNNPPQQFAGFEDFYRDAVTGAEDALTGQMMRGGGGNVVSGLQNANAANRNLRTIEDAANRSAGGSVTETPFVFSPSQLQRAGMATQKKFPGPRPFADLADAAQSVLPNRIPNSGTADRALQVALPAAIAGGSGIGLAAGGDAQSAGVGASIPTAALILAALGGTRQGQRLINASLNRPASVQRLGGTIRRNAGLFGSGAIPLVMSN